jgi:hypothetical protein
METTQIGVEVNKAKPLDFKLDSDIKQIMKEVTKCLTLVIKLIRYLVDGKIGSDDFKRLNKKYIERLEIALSHREQAEKVYLHQAKIFGEELMEADQEYDIIRVRNLIGDMDSEEFKLKSHAAQWDIDNIKKKMSKAEGSYKYLNNFQNLLRPEEMADLKDLTKKKFEAVEKSDLNESAKSDVKKRLGSFIQLLKK